MTRAPSVPALAAACLLPLSAGCAALGVEPNVASLLAAGTAAVLYGCLARLATGVTTGSVGMGICLLLVAAAHFVLGTQPTPARLAAIGLVCALAVPHRAVDGD